MFEALDPNLRVPWGIGMRTPSLVTARLMETWAHGLDVCAALGEAANDTDRLAHVAWLATRALPYAYSLAGANPPADPLRVELTLPSGAQWSTGPVDAPIASPDPRGVLPSLRTPRQARRHARLGRRRPGCHLRVPRWREHFSEGRRG